MFDRTTWENPYAAPLINRREPGQLIGFRDLFDLDTHVARTVLFRCYETYARRFLVLEEMEKKQNVVHKKDAHSQTVPQLALRSEPQLQAILLEAGVSPQAVLLLRDHMHVVAV